jgi:hypothetical protein
MVAIIDSVSVGIVVYFGRSKGTNLDNHCVYSTNLCFSEVVKFIARISCEVETLAMDGNCHTSSFRRVFHFFSYEFVTIKYY